MSTTRKHTTAFSLALEHPELFLVFGGRVFLPGDKDHLKPLNLDQVEKFIAKGHL